MQFSLALGNVPSPHARSKDQPEADLVFRDSPFWSRDELLYRFFIPHRTLCPPYWIVRDTIRFLCIR